MIDLNQLRTDWHTAQREAFNALEFLLDNWNDPKAHTRYQNAVSAEKTKEFIYLAAIVAGKKQNLKRAKK